MRASRRGSHAWRLRIETRQMILLFLRLKSRDLGSEVVLDLRVRLILPSRGL
jgi:hypothetical protein